MAGVASKILTKPSGFLLLSSPLSHPLWFLGKSRPKLLDSISRYHTKFEDDRRREQILYPWFRRADLRCYSRDFFNTIEYVLPEDPEREKEPRLKIFGDGIKRLLGGSDLEDGQKLLCLQVVVDERHDILEKQFINCEESAAAAKAPKVEVVTGLLADYSEFFVKSCSIVLNKVNEMDFSEHSSDDGERSSSRQNHLRFCFSEVSLILLINNYDISDQGITSNEDLANFLLSLRELGDKIQKVDVNCSSAKFVRDGEHIEYYHRNLF